MDAHDNKVVISLESGWHLTPSTSINSHQKHIYPKMAFPLLRLLVLITVTAIGCLPARADLGALRLTRKIQESRVAVGIHLSEVSRSLAAAMEANSQASLDLALKNLEEEMDRQIADVSELSVGENLEASVLRDGYLEFMRWQRDELPPVMRMAYEASRQEAPGSDTQHAAVKAVLGSIVEGERSRLETLDRLEREAMESSTSYRSVATGEGRTVFYELGRRLTWPLIVVALVAVVIWMSVRRSLRSSRNRAMRLSKATRGDHDDPF